MKCVERWIHKIAPGKWDEWLEVEKKWDAIERRLGGFPAKRRYRAIFGSEDVNTFVWEREWESFPASEAAYGRMMDDPEAQKLGRDFALLVESKRGELYWPLP